MKNYTCLEVEELIQMYINDLGGELTEVREGVLGYGQIILHDAPNKKSVIITERYVNCWSSTHTIRCYNKLPKKYQEFININ